MKTPTPSDHPTAPNPPESAAHADDWPNTHGRVVDAAGNAITAAPAPSAARDEVRWQEQYALTCLYIEKSGKLERALGALVDAVNVEFGDGRSNIGGKTGPALIQAVDALADASRNDGPVGKRLEELRNWVKAESLDRGGPTPPTKAETAGYLAHERADLLATNAALRDELAKARAECDAYADEKRAINAALNKTDSRGTDEVEQIEWLADQLTALRAANAGLKAALGLSRSALKRSLDGAPSYDGFYSVHRKALAAIDAVGVQDAKSEKPYTGL